MVSEEVIISVLTFVVVRVRVVVTGALLAADPYKPNAIAATMINTTTAAPKIPLEIAAFSLENSFMSILTR